MDKLIRLMNELTYNRSQAPTVQLSIKISGNVDTIVDALFDVAKQLQTGKTQMSQEQAASGIKWSVREI